MFVDIKVFINSKRLSVIILKFFNYSTSVLKQNPKQKRGEMKQVNMSHYI